MSLKEKERVFTDDRLESQIRAFRNEDRGEEAYIVFGYQGTPNTLSIVAEGTGGLTSAADHFGSNDSFYALLRKDHKVDVAKTVKFVFVDWTPDTVPALRKAVLATHKGQVKKLCEPYHVPLEATTRSELDENEVNQKIAFVSGTALYVTDKGPISNKATGVDALGKAKSAASTSGLAVVPDSITQSRAVSISDEASLRSAVSAVRDDSSPVNWMTVSYLDDRATLALRGQGSGGIDEMMKTLTPDTVWYGFFRVNEQFDKTSNVRFGHFKYLPASLPWTAMQRAKLSTHQGAVKPLFEPYHTDFDITKPDELSVAIVTERFQSIMGTKNRVVDSSAVNNSNNINALSSYKTANSYSNAAGPGNLVPIQSTGALAFEGGEATFKETLKKVRNDDDPTNWFVASYVKANTLAVVGTGTGGLEEMKAAFGSSHAHFGLLRVTDVVDNNVTTKFVYVKSMPDTVPPMLKAGLSTKKEHLDKLFSPFHCDFFVGSSPSELSQADVQSKVSQGSGSAAGSRVR